MKYPLAALLLLLTSCDKINSRSSETSSSARIATIVQLLPTCPTNRQQWTAGTVSESAVSVLPVIAEIGKTVIAKGVKAGVQFLKDRQSDLNATSSARDTEEFYSIKDSSDLSAKYGCIVFVRGEVGGQLAKGPEDGYFSTARLNILRSDKARIPNEKINLAKAPIVYAEFSIEYFGDPANAFLLRPNFLDYRETAAKTTRSQKKSLVFSFDFGKPGDASADKALPLFAKFTLSFPDVPYKTRWTTSDFVTQVSEVQLLPSGSAKTPIDLSPISVVGTLAEAEDPSEFERVLTSLLDDSSEDVGNALGDAFKDWVKSHGEEAAVSK